MDSIARWILSNPARFEFVKMSSNFMKPFIQISLFANSMEICLVEFAKRLFCINPQRIDNISRS